LPGQIQDQITRMVRLSFSTEMLAESSKPGGLVNKQGRAWHSATPLRVNIGTYVEKALEHGLKASTELFGVMGAEISPLAKPLHNQDTGRMNWNTAAHIMGHLHHGRRSEGLRGRSLGQDARCSESLDRRLKRVPHERNVQSHGHTRGASIADSGCH